MKTISQEEAGQLDARITAHGVLEGLSSEQLGDLEAHGVYMEYHQEPVVSDGHDIGYFFYILRGTFEVSKVNVETNQKTILASLGIGECFGEMSFFTNAPASANVMATDKVICWAMPHARLRQFIEIHSGGAHLAINISNLLARRVQEGNTRLMGLNSSLSAYFGRKAHMSQAKAITAPSSNDPAEMEIPDEVFDDFARDTLQLSPDAPLTPEQRGQIRGQIETNEIDIIPWLERGRRGKNLRVRLKFVEEQQSAKVSVTTPTSRPSAQPTVVRVPQVRARVAPVKAYVKQSSFDFWRVANFLITILLPILSIYLFIAFMPLDARQVLADSPDFKSLPMQGLWQKVIFNTRGSSHEALLQKDASYTIGMSLKKPSRMSGTLKLKQNLTAPLSIRISIQSPTGGIIFQKTTEIPPNKDQILLFSAPVPPGSFQLDFSCDNWPENVNIPSTLDVEARL